LAFEQAEIQTKYQGYIDKEIALADKMKRLDTVKIPKAYDYSCLASLSHEAKEKLTAIQPTNLAQASRISGINPSDIAVLLVQLCR
jgi:tRNA uridine 5-carboxymethylaminomethyl modification enzyme